ncbi:MAG TPA: antibiotic biosynthesis monooxygenase [Porticoccaceae bacterium]|jgi:quinol monooxygenase YgiN|nr:antibiotic biosynthesis monooxygenase [Porticoccaceae bacterium]
MIGVIATLKIQDGKQAGFEALMKELTAAVRANEPACTLYQLHKTDESTTYVMLEQYGSPADLEAHRVTPHFKELGGKLGEFLAGAPEVQVMPAVE